MVVLVFQAVSRTASFSFVCIYVGRRSNHRIAAELGQIDKMGIFRWHLNLVIEGFPVSWTNCMASLTESEISTRTAPRLFATPLVPSLVYMTTSQRLLWTTCGYYPSLEEHEKGQEILLNAEPSLHRPRLQLTHDSLFSRTTIVKLRLPEYSTLITFLNPPTMVNAEQVIRMVPELRPMREILDLEEYTRKNHGIGLDLVNCHVRHWSCASIAPILIPIFLS